MSRFRGHAQTWGEGHDAEKPTPVSAGVRLTDVDSKHLGDELDLAVDWTVNSWLSLSSVGAVLFPGAALREGAGNDADWGHFMLWAVVSF